jgi:putative nucleotidyltransferase with HDIG domain
MIKPSDVIQNPKVQYLIKSADAQLAALGYTEHGIRHVTWVAKRAGYILRELKYPERTAELAEIAGFLHDIGNAINREHHAQTGAILAYEILKEMGMKFEEIIEVVRAIGNHHEEDGLPATPVSAALILADKADVHRSRVRPIGDIKSDIHDRVNYAAISSKVIVKNEGAIRNIIYDITIDTQIAPVMEYFQIFLSRMLIASKAAKTLDAAFSLYINKTKMT